MQKQQACCPTCNQQIPLPKSQSSSSTSTSWISARLAPRYIDSPVQDVHVSTFALVNAYVNSVLLIIGGIKYLLLSFSTTNSQPSTTPFQSSLLAILFTILGLGYLLSIFHRQYEFLYLSIPARLLMGFLATIIWFTDSSSTSNSEFDNRGSRGSRSGEQSRRSTELLVMMIYDTVCALVGGWTMGSWNGRMRRVKKVADKAE